MAKRGALSELYAGTELGGKWWKPYRKNGFLVRGNGQHAFEEDALTFKRLLASNPIRIPYSAITGLRAGSWHAGRWIPGGRLVKVDWIAPDGSAPSSGFAFAGQEPADSFQQTLERVITHAPN